jgi:hypothetical protein
MPGGGTVPEPTVGVSEGKRVSLGTSVFVLVRDGLAVALGVLVRVGRRVLVSVAVRVNIPAVAVSRPEARVAR